MALIRLRVCAGWSEPLLVAHATLLEISCRGSIIVSVLTCLSFYCRFENTDTFVLWNCKRPIYNKTSLYFVLNLILRANFKAVQWEKGWFYHPADRLYKYIRNYTGKNVTSHQICWQLNCHGLWCHLLTAVIRCSVNVHWPVEKPQ